MSRADTAGYVLAAATLAALTLLRYGLRPNGLAWSFAQIVLVAIAYVDTRERRIPNALILPLGACALALRVVFQRQELVEVVTAGVVAFVVFLLLAVAARGGLGMGDVKLAAAEGLLLGRVATQALLLGIVAGGVAALLLLGTHRASRKTTYAYGPYLVFGAAVAILGWHPAPLV